MNVVALGIRNVGRNLIRSSSIIIILSMCMSLALIMLVADQAVAAKINAVKSAVGNTISIQPDGFSPGSQVNNALTTTQLLKVKKIAHVTD
ncbi:MAG TPA: hypothetical protein VGR89_14875, partial [Puia sp.]|nr:hypothetical protein [Puia sp.]